MKKFTFFFVFLLTALLSVATLAQTNFWQQTNYPYMDMGSALAINSIGTIFVGTNNGVVHSSDNGVNWIESYIGMDLHLSDIAINSFGTIFAATIDKGIYRSTDDGANWTLVDSGMTYGLAFKSLAINVSGHIFAGSWDYDGGSVLRSTDDGASWINTGLVSNTYALAINASGHIFAGGWTSSGGVVFRSTDNGTSWTNTGMATSYYNVVKKLAISPAGHIFAVTSINGVYRSTDDGEHWTPIFWASWITSLAINASGHIFAGTFGEGVYRSTDDGANWTTVNSGLTNNSVVSIAINASGTIFAGTAGGGLFRSVQSTTSVRELSADAPISFSLNQNYPNPFNPTTTIQFQVPNSSFVDLKVYDILGNEVATLVSEEKPAGSYEVNFNASQLSSGIYFYQIRTDDPSSSSGQGFIETKNMILLK